jgi:hypothetical protein
MLSQERADFIQEADLRASTADIVDVAHGRLAAVLEILQTMGEKSNLSLAADEILLIDHIDELYLQHIQMVLFFGCP